MLERGLKFTQRRSRIAPTTPITLSFRKARLNKARLNSQVNRHQSVDDLGISYA
jgi:hypothetical protein